MKVLLAGATGTLGVPLVRALVASGHEVIGLSRTLGKGDMLPALSAEPLVADAMDRNALLGAVDGLKADAVAHKLTALKKPPMRHSGMAATDALRVRRKGECEQSLISCLCLTGSAGSDPLCSKGTKHCEILNDGALATGSVDVRLTGPLADDERNHLLRYRLTRGNIGKLKEAEKNLLVTKLIKHYPTQDGELHQKVRLALKAVGLSLA